MSCQQWSGTMIDHAAGELREEDSIRLEQHAAECAACAREMRALAQIVRPEHAARTAQDASRFDALAGRIWDAAHPPRREGARVRFSRFFRRPLPAFATAVAAAALILVGFLAGHETARRSSHETAIRSTRGPAISSPESQDPLVDFVPAPSELADLTGATRPDTL